MNVAEVRRRLGVEESLDTTRELSGLDWDRILQDLSEQSYQTRLAFVTALALAQSVTGECRVRGCSGSASVFPVLTDDGLHWECNNPSPIHKSKIVVGKA